MISLVVIAVVALIVTGIHLSNPYLRKRVVEMLGQKFHADVELKEFHVFLFPGVRIEGSGLALRHQGRARCSAPDFNRRSSLPRPAFWDCRGSRGRWTRSSSRGWSYRSLPRGTEGIRDWPKAKNIPVLIGEIVSDDAELRLLPKCRR